MNLISFHPCLLPQQIFFKKNAFFNNLTDYLLFKIFMNILRCTNNLQF